MAAGSSVESVSVDDLSVSDLIRLNRQTLYALRERGVIRTLSQPQGEWAETLVKLAYGGELAPKSEKGYDVIAPDGTRLQVKARALDYPRIRSNITSAIRSWEFDKMVVVLLDLSDLSVAKAAELSLETVHDNARHRSHVNGSVLIPNEALMSQGIDVTEQLQAATRKL
ncbi:MAG: hypothetical protein F4Z00_12365 [Acidimicrobiaceae bacterium]|nr:hypothetical protein [Acidimicrobiaceae bacterium]MXZ66322.1 hypothetical protein [Acidimicrobiaceae bacterium]MYF32321.1 hypothetical protein [Acidimicrobiaceae bacterium]MYG77519.1 hypothetical protein [Acidimicrobiaceae bacterium]